MAGIVPIPHLPIPDPIELKVRPYKRYSSETADIVFIIYVLAIILWAVLIMYLNPTIEGFGTFILFIPFITFFISMMSLGHLTKQSEDSVNSSLFITAGLVITVPLLTVVARDFGGDQREKDKVVFIIMTAVTLALLSIIDVWVPLEYSPIVKHVKSIFQTGFFTLILFTIYYHYYHTGLNTNATIVTMTK
jgi:hypothetical protein